MSVIESSNLRDLLRVPHNEDDGRDSLAGLTLAAVLGVEGDIRRPSRTLLDIIKDEESGAAYRGLVPPTANPHNNTSWKGFKNRLRLRRAGAAFSSSTSSNPANDCDISIDECDIRISTPVLIERRGVNSGLFRNSSTVSPPNGANLTSPVETPRRGEMVEGMPNTDMEVNGVEQILDRETQTEDHVHIPATEVVPENNTSMMAVEAVAPPRVSLMALLEETDWSVGGSMGSIVMDTDEVEEEEKKDGEVDIVAGNEGGGEYVCCVCMVRHKGAAFIPCGHTFCRLCSRELWVNRGNCPLCNGYILEILDIF